MLQARCHRPRASHRFVREASLRWKRRSVFRRKLALEHAHTTRAKFTGRLCLDAKHFAQAQTDKFIVILIGKLSPPSNELRKTANVETLRQTAAEWTCQERGRRWHQLRGGFQAPLETLHLLEWAPLRPRCRLEREPPFREVAGPCPDRPRIDELQRWRSEATSDPHVAGQLNSGRWPHLVSRLLVCPECAPNGAQVGFQLLDSPPPRQATQMGPEEVEL